MSDSDEQLDQVASGDQPAPTSEAQSNSFRGFEGSTYLRYQVLGDLEGEFELNVEDHLGVSQDVLDRAINESGETYYELEDISDQLRALSPIVDLNSEIELAQSGRDESDNSQIRTSSRRNSLVSRRISFFDNMATATTAITTSSITTSSTITTSASTMYTHSGVGSVMSTMPHVDQGHDSAALRTMKWLEMMVECDSNDLEERIHEILESFEDEDNYHIPADKVVCIAEMKGLERQLEIYNRTLRQECTSMNKERIVALRKKMLKYARDIKLLKVAAGYDETKDLAIQQIATPPQEFKLAKVKPLEFPRFDGTDYSVFISWKMNMDEMLNSTSIPQNMWGVIVYSHLDGKAKKYVGSRGNWQGKYKELLEKLDSRYANRWTMAAETIKCSIMSTPPEDDWQSMVEYIDDQLDCIRSITYLDLSPEQLAVNVLLMKLPEDFANAIRNGIRIKRQDKGLKDFKFTPDEFRDVLNDTVVTWKTTSPNLVASTAVLCTTLKQNKVSEHNECDSSVHGASACDGGARGSFKSGSPRRNVHNRSFNSLKCQLCDGEHTTSGCQSYLTAVARRTQLSALNKCPNCARVKHDGTCKLSYRCRICNQGLHMDYLCPGVSSS